ncbi:MAG: nucleotidyltransferase substrate binding protein [Spirochaetales bacterium]|nr:nucleotidyltransferase substrate binding protein [Spirochaetales bacterium]
MEKLKLIVDNSEKALNTLYEIIQALEMTDDRNMTSHTYHEELAEQIYKKIKQYYTLMNNLLKTIKKRLETK